MRKINICAVGKLKDRHLASMCESYYRRCRRTVTIEEAEYRSPKELEASWPSRGVVVVLDERGKQISSRDFAEKLENWLSSGNACVSFVIGGAEGLPEPLRNRGDIVLSLGPMTIAHRLVRLVLAEQLYRAVSLLEGSPYHR